MEVRDEFRPYPPWLTDFRTGRWSASAHYAGMTIERICAMPVVGIAADNAHLHLWCPAHLLPEGLAVLHAWGFCYRTNLAWVKTGRPETGNYYRTMHELLLLGVRGNAKRFVDRATPSVFEAPRRRHSEKPPIHGMIERCSPAPYLELFARSVAKGWSAGRSDRPGEVRRSLRAADNKKLADPISFFSLPSIGAAAPRARKERTRCVGPPRRPVSGVFGRSIAGLWASVKNNQLQFLVIRRKLKRSAPHEPEFVSYFECSRYRQ